MRHAFCQKHPRTCERCSIARSAPCAFTRHETSRMRRLVVTHQTDRIALGILYKRHPFLCTRRSETVIGMTEDDLRLGDDLYGFRTQRFERLSHIVDLEVDECARRGLLKQQAYLTCLEEQQARRIEDPAGSALSKRW